MMYRLLQFTRDLFEPEPLVRAAMPPAPESGSSLKQIIAKTQVDRAQYAIENIATPGPEQAPAVFRHPGATRQALLDGVLVAYAFRRSARRSIGFSVGAAGLAVSAPKWVALRAIDEAVLEKSGWILRKLHETRERHQRAESARVEWQDGAIVPYLGAGVRLRTGLGLAAAQLDTSASDGFPVLALPLEQHAPPEEIRCAAQDWLTRQARPLFVARLDHFAPLLQVQWRKLSLSSARTRWGSASACGAIRLNWRLLHFKPAVIDYVVVHELSHLRVMDHSPRFWATVASVMPDYAARRAELKEESIPRG